MSEKRTACLISFRGRENGSCAAIAEELRRWYRERATIRSFAFSSVSVTPCGRCGYQCFQARELCPYFSDSELLLCEAVLDSDCACFIVPNYCDYPCANFFIFNERSQCCFQQRPDLLEKYLAVPKKFIVVSNSSQDNFTAAFRYHVAENTEPEILFLSAKSFGKSSAAGDLMDSAQARAALLEFTETALH